MKTVAYASPHVPIEWIAAHGVRPVRLNPRVEGEASPLALRRGVCPFAGAVLDVVVAGVDACAVIFTTACDQMRYACAAAEPSTRVPLFLLNVPSTWQTPTAGRLFREEVERLGRFLVELGGTTPADEELADVMLRFERERATARATYVRHSSLTSLFGQAGKPDVPWSPGFGRLKPVLQQESQAGPDVDWGRAAVPLALVGGPLLDNDREIFSIVEGAGGSIVLDATEQGERVTPPAFDRARLCRDPLGELVDAYLRIPDAFRRPNTALYEWLGCAMGTREVRGIILRRYVWCDLWHAEVDRLRRWSPVPVLDLDGDRDDQSARGRTVGRIEAFLEMLR